MQLEKPITLGQFLKVKDVIYSGGEAKQYLEHNSVYVNGELEKRRGRKLQPGDTVSVHNKSFIVE